MWVYCIRPHRSTTYLLAASIVRAKGSLQIGRACASGDENGCAIADACSIEAHRDQGGARSRLGLACNQGIWLARFYWANAATADPAAPPQEIKRAYDLACGRSSPAQSLAYTRLAVRDRSAGEACCALAELVEKRSWPPPTPSSSDLRIEDCNLGVEKCCHLAG
jgi:hypothetical protein